MSQASRMRHSNGSALLRDKNDLLLFLHGMNHSILMMLMLMALLSVYSWTLSSIQSRGGF